MPAKGVSVFPFTNVEGQRPVKTSPVGYSVSTVRRRMQRAVGDCGRTFKVNLTSSLVVLRLDPSNGLDIDASLSFFKITQLKCFNIL